VICLDLQTLKPEHREMSLSIGQQVWVPCEVKPGPFADQRMVQVNSPAGTWLGFVSTAGLRSPVGSGTTEVRAVVLDLVDGRVRLQVLGDPLLDSVYQDLVSRVSPIGPFQS
jgi:hypothetical protein